MQRACAMLSSVAPARLYNIFPHYLVNGAIFEKKKVTEQLLKETFLILGGIQQDTVR